MTSNDIERKGVDTVPRTMGGWHQDRYGAPAAGQRIRFQSRLTERRQT
jgi:hypothetical protein